MRGTGLIDTLFPKARHQILGALLLDPDVSWTLTDLAKHYDTTPSTLQRELAALVEATIIFRRSEGGKVLYQANVACPIFPELQGLLVKTFGLVDRVRDALSPMSHRISLAILHGSFARGAYDGGRSIDILIVGNPHVADVNGALEGLEEFFGRPVHAAILSTAEFAAKADTDDYFVSSVLEQPNLLVMGDEMALAA